MLGILMRQMRLYQWPKNFLIFVPLLTSHQILNQSHWHTSLITFLCFCLAASAGYQFNDLMDVSVDKQHADKSQRPFAKGQITKIQCISIAIVTLFLTLSLSIMISTDFTKIIILYLALSLSYSWFLKPIYIIDVLTLALLYLVRIFGGALAIGVSVSDWLLAFSSFLFLSLAIMKRVVAIQRQPSKSYNERHSYQASDSIFLLVLGLSSALTALVLFTLYIQDPVIVARFNTIEWLWGVCGVLLYWILRLWFIVYRKQMYDDIAEYIIQDKLSWVLFGIALLFFTTAI